MTQGGHTVQGQDSMSTKRPSHQDRIGSTNALDSALNGAVALLIRLLRSIFHGKVLLAVADRLRVFRWPMFVVSSYLLLVHNLELEIRK